MRKFRDRRDAGAQLAESLATKEPDLRGASSLVLALPRGGVPIGYEIANRLGAPLDILVVRKLGVPGHDEVAMGAIASGGARVIDQDFVAELGISSETLQQVIDREQAELVRRERVFRGDRIDIDVRGKTVIVVDDGLATGSTMLAAIQALREKRPAEIHVAVPVASPETCDAIGEYVDGIHCLATPEPFIAVGLWYEDFTQTTDAEVRMLLEAAQREHPPRATRTATHHHSTAR